MSMPSGLPLKQQASRPTSNNGPTLWIQQVYLLPRAHLCNDGSLIIAGDEVLRQHRKIIHLRMLYVCLCWTVVVDIWICSAADVHGWLGDCDCCHSRLQF